MFFFFKQKTAYEWRISDWSSDVCSSDLGEAQAGGRAGQDAEQPGAGGGGGGEGADGTDDHHALEAEVEDAGLLHNQLAERGEEQRRRGTDDGDRKSVVGGRSVSVRVDLGGVCSHKKKKNKINNKK